MQYRKLPFLALLTVLCLLGACPVQAEICTLPTAAELARLNGSDDVNAQVRQFVSNSGLFDAQKAATKAVKEQTIYVRMLTPLNSNFNFPGDPVSAEVVAAPDGSSVLPVGTRLSGFVEGIQPSARMSQNGAIEFKFYCANFANENVDLTAGADESRIALPMQHISGKQRLRNVLMFSARLAIPLAIGTGGTSLAITTGAGALIGAALCDNHRYLAGAVRGAWEGAGLSVFDPLIQKGRTIVVPEGSTVALTLSGPAELPVAWSGKPPASDNRSSLNTSVKLLSVISNPNQPPDKPAGQVADAKRDDDIAATLAKVQSFLDEKNMAQAMATMAAIPAAESGNDAVQAMRARLLLYVTGQSIQDSSDKKDSNGVRSP